MLCGNAAEERVDEGRVNWAQHILIFFVRLYQWVISPAKSALFGPMGQCRFTPSCSQYAVEAVRVHGAAKGGAMAVWRICRCNPWGDCGDDPVPQPKREVSPVADARAANTQPAMGGISTGRN